MTKRLQAAGQWLAPGTGLKRWLVVLFIGIIILALGTGLFLRELYEASGYPIWIQWLTLQRLPRWLRVTIFAGIGVGLVWFSLYRLNQTFLRAFLPQQTPVTEVPQLFRQARRRQQGPRIVTIGGGTGMSNLLRGLKHHTDNLTAIVTVADDGGSSGRLRESLGVLPPGDFRNCIAALANEGSLTTQLFQYRYASQNDNGGNALQGHSFGNLFITTMAEVTGSFEQALMESGKVLAIRGRIFPSTLKHVTLYADVRSTETQPAARVVGESAIPKSAAPIERVYLQPDTVPAFPEAIKALLAADLIVLGPGSLYTSLLPNLLITEINQAIRAVQVPVLYVANVATQLGETEGYTLSDHINALEKHIGPNLFSHILVNNNLNHPLPPNWTLNLINPVIPDKISYGLVKADVIESDRPWRHDANKLAKAIINWYQMEIKD